MKKLLAIILCCLMVVSLGACTSNETGNTETTVPTEAVELSVTDDKIKELEEKFSDFDGIIYLTHKGEVVFTHAKGKDECENDLTVESPMYIGSVSKQFCATAVMILKEQNKLSVDDTLDKYFPEYEIGKGISLKNLLTMRSGIPEMLGGAKGFSADKTESENTAILKEWIFDQPLNFEPDTKCEYSNTNYFLLANIVEMVSGQHYNDFIRENIFKPLSMENTGFINEVKDNEFYSKSLTYETFAYEDDADGVAKGAGNIVSTAPDMDKWMTGLVSSQIISQESYSEMIVDYSPDTGDHYGYGLMGLYKKGKGHSGLIGTYVSIDYFNEEYDCNLFVSTSTGAKDINNIPAKVMDVLLSD